MDQNLLKLLQDAKKASQVMKTVDTTMKNRALKSIANALIAHVDEIIEANQKDIEKAKETMSTAMIDRLLLNKERIENMSQSLLKLIHLPDPIGEVIEEIERPNGLIIRKVRIPIGVFGIIYESRPNVTVDIAGLCLKSSNVCVLRGGKEAIESNRILTHIIQEAIQDYLPKEAVQLIEDTNRELVNELICAREYVDVIVPRGGKRLIQFVCQNAKVPVIETGAGNCHLYIDKDVDMKKAIDISVNAKMQRPSVCNSIETILVHKEIARRYLPALYDAYDGYVDIRGDYRTRQIIDCHEVLPIDYETEYNDYVVAIKVVDSLEEAIAHIQRYSTHHSESIITENQEAAEIFMNMLDSACVYWNASTRFSDGGEFGFGAELGISTQKLHARGPLALKEMTTYQYHIYGQGQIRKS